MRNKKLKPPPVSEGKLIASKAIKQATVSTDSLRPTFSFHHLQKHYCISECNTDEKAAFADTMWRLTQLTWGQLRAAGRHGLGYEQIPTYSIKAAIPANITEDVKFIAFRFFGKAPMVGYRSSDGTFHVIWFDRDFTLYDHGS